MSYKVYWLFKETDEPFGSGFIYSRGEVGVRAGFLAAISPSPVAAVLFFFSFLLRNLGSSPPGRNQGELLMWGLGTTPASHLHSTIRRGMQGKTEEVEKGAQLDVNLLPALGNLGSQTTLFRDSVGQRGFWALSRAWLAWETPDSHCGEGTPNTPLNWPSLPLRPLDSSDEANGYAGSKGKNSRQLSCCGIKITLMLLTSAAPS